MVAYSFKPRFAPLILDGTKAQTIRGARKRHARPGEQLQLYTGMRTKHCRMIARAQCVSVVPVRLVFNARFGPLTFEVDGIPLGSDEMEAFAAADGFGAEDGFAALDMREFWFANHGRGVAEIDFRGELIRWAPMVTAEYLPEARQSQPLEVADA